MNDSRGRGRLVVTADGTGVEGLTGTVLLSRTADRVGLTTALRQAVDGCRTWRDHPPGRVVGDLAVMLADGGRCTEDIETLRRRHVAVFGHVASQPTAWRTMEALAADELVDIRLFDALATARTNAWAAGAAPPGWEDPTVPATIDIDATLVTAHSEKDRTAGTYKGGYGFHPLLAWLDRTDGHGEPLGVLLRPGNAGANHAGDNIDVLEQALANLPALPAGKQVIVRGDSAMATKEFCSYARQCGVAVSVSLPIGRQPRIQAAIRTLHADTPDVWQAAVRQDGTVREGAHVAELHDPPLAEGWPAGMRVIVRREPLHPAPSRPSMTSTATASPQP